MKKLLLALCAALGLLAPLSAAPTFNGDLLQGIVAAPGTGAITVSFTENQTSNAELFVVIGTEANITGASWTAKYAGVSMSGPVLNDFIGGSIGTIQQAFYLNGPANGANNVVIQPGGAGYFAGPVAYQIFTFDSANGVGATNGNQATIATGSPWPVNVTITPTQSTSTILELGYLGVGCPGTPSWTLATSNGTEIFVVNYAQAADHAMGFADWAAATTSNVNFSLTFTASCSSSGDAAGMALEILAAANTATPTFTISPTFTASPTATPTATPTRTITQTFTASPTNTPTYTATPTATPTFTISPTATPTASPTDSPSPTATVTLTPVQFYPYIPIYRRRR